MFVREWKRTPKTSGAYFANAIKIKRELQYEVLFLFQKNASLFLASAATEAQTFFKMSVI